MLTEAQRTRALDIATDGATQEELNAIRRAQTRARAWSKKKRKHRINLDRAQRFDGSDLLLLCLVLAFLATALSMTGCSHRRRGAPTSPTDTYINERGEIDDYLAEMMMLDECMHDAIPECQGMGD